MGALYTAVATASGDGRNGKARTDDGELVVDLAVPKEMGGTGGATNPEQLFAAGYAACFHSALKLVASRGKARISDTAVTAEVSINAVDGRAFQLAVALHAEIGGVDQETADRLVEQAHQVCPYSNATRGNIEVTVDATVG
ncbi:organic hydroperoxide resistance protein [Arthrobacter burdickii]|uniref:Organic hydroperoxide resistance protein n=1 Tax=Arthrobacter burdickii TaxID=3035920 RepID=A0ABT8JZX4_9MICC|nr:organic hydroperoxide resistance protein [Arthrobacter burdickii]MDN4610497.1 organic hydroperoxide resistance protein [Arthrobacter burdickii]